MNYLAIAVLRRAARGRGPAAVDQQKRCRGARAARRRRGAGAADQQMWRRGGRAAQGSGLADRRRCAVAQGSPSPKIRPGAASSSASLSPSRSSLSLSILSRFCRDWVVLLLDFAPTPSISRPPLSAPRFPAGPSDFPPAPGFPVQNPIYGARLVLWDT